MSPPSPMPPGVDAAPLPRPPDSVRDPETLRFACPSCRTPLEHAEANAQRCPAEGTVYRRVEGIWHFLTPERTGYFARFIREYAHVRAAEGRGADEAAYYRALPFADLTNRAPGDWRIRARSYRALVRRVIEPLERRSGRALRVLDLGAGNGWLSYQLARRGHQAVAVDLQTNRRDGLGAFIHFPEAFVPVQAEFDALPFPDEAFNLAVFNGSFHYAIDYAATLREAMRVLGPEGVLVVLDSPVYRDGTSGARMVRERERHFTARYGFPSNALPSEHYLTHDRLRALAGEVGVTWSVHAPFYGWRWALRPWYARLRSHREPARFLVIAGRRQAAPDRARGAGLLPSAPESALRRLYRRAWSAWLRVRFTVFQRHRYDRLVLEEAAGLRLVVLPGVFNPKLFRTGEFLAETLTDRLCPPGAQVLDLGTGSGIGAVAAAARGARVEAVDVNPRAVWCARLNARLNGVEPRVTVHEGDLFAPVQGRRFDLVLFNPPYFRGEPRDALDWAWRSADVVERFAAGLPDHLSRPGGCALVVLSTDGDPAGFLQAFQLNGLRAEVLARRDLINEEVAVYRLTAGGC